MERIVGRYTCSRLADGRPPAELSRSASVGNHLHLLVTRESQSRNIPAIKGISHINVNSIELPAYKSSQFPTTRNKERAICNDSYQVLPFHV